jgi:peptidoglycan/xylan/chitin deacetylase (PgdA/CDA1 family)
VRIGFSKISASTILAGWFILSGALGTVARSESASSPNELGLVMILMYHEIGERESTWSRNSKNFRNDLERLYSLGYRPISLRDFVKNEISTPRGLSPVVLTFDDGTKGQFRVETRDGEKIVDPNSAVGILEAFHAEHLDFPLEATFFLNGNTPFFQPDLVEYKLNYLVHKGFDIGNHSTRHQNLASAEMQSAAKIQGAIGNQLILLKKLLKDHPHYAIDTLALCYGARPRTPRLRSYLKTGISNGVRYEHIAVLKVGGGPAFSPADQRLNPLSLPRIRASARAPGTLGIDGWLDFFEANREKRYVSDGDASTVTVPKSRRKQLNQRLLGKKRLLLLE